jgi:hypothetical protein
MPWGSASRRRGTENVSAGTHKLVWFVPREALDSTREAVFAAGAGRIGDYTRCSWYTAGTGTFRGGAKTDPAVGEAGREERATELRVETVVPAERLREVVVALVAAHPYEEVAYDVYPLVDLGPEPASEAAPAEPEVAPGREVEPRPGPEAESGPGPGHEPAPEPGPGP